jgi:hypothetical protein
LRGPTVNNSRAGARLGPGVPAPTTPGGQLHRTEHTRRYGRQGVAEHHPELHSNDHAIANEFASSARRTVAAALEGGPDALQLATAEALLAIFHQLKHMEATSITLKGGRRLQRIDGPLSWRLEDH